MDEKDIFEFFDIDPDDLVFHDDLGEDSLMISILENLVKKIKGRDALFGVDPTRFTKAVSIATSIIKTVQENCSNIEYAMAYDNIIGKDLILTITGTVLSFDKYATADIRRKNDDLIGSIDISPLSNGDVELLVSFKDIRKRMDISGTEDQTKI